MSAGKVKQITRKLNIVSAIWANDVLTVTCSAAHGLVSGDVITFMDQEFPTLFSSAITGVSGASSEVFTVACTNKNIKVPTTLETGIWNATATGAQEKFTWAFGTYPVGAIQVNTNSTGTVTVKVEASLDGILWVDAAGAQAVGTTSAYIFDISKPYIYGRLNFTVAIGGAGGKVTAFKTVA